MLVSVNCDVECWGENQGGSSKPPVDRFTAVSVGYAHSCGIRRDGILNCWRSNHRQFKSEFMTGPGLEFGIRYGQAKPPSGVYQSRAPETRTHAPLTGMKSLPAGDPTIVSA